MHTGLKIICPDHNFNTFNDYKLWQTVLIAIFFSGFLKVYKLEYPIVVKRELLELFSCNPTLEAKLHCVDKIFEWSRLL